MPPVRVPENERQKGVIIMTEKQKELKSYVEKQKQRANNWITRSDIKQFAEKLVVLGAIEEQEILLRILEKAFDDSVSPEDLQRFINSLPERSFLR